MKQTLLLGLLVLGSLTTWAQNALPTVYLNCPEPPQASSKPVSATVTRPAPSMAIPSGSGSERIVPTCTGVINVNIHYMLRLDGTGNFNESNDGTPYKPWNANRPIDPTISPDTANNGYAWARVLVTEMNNQAATNPMNGYPAGTSNPPKGFLFALNGVYFHRVGADEFLVKKTGQVGYYTTAPFDNYGVNKPTEINMFICGDYADNVSPFDVGGIACRLGYNPATPNSYWVKLFNSHLMYEWRQVHNGDNTAFPGSTVVQNAYLQIANSLGHEIGHVTGLAHTFDGASGCADAAVAAPGQGWSNLMDYTGGYGKSLTPCQIGVINYNLYNPANPVNSFRNFLSSSYCDQVPPRAFFVMPACLSPGNVQMDSRGTFMANQMTVRVYAYDATTVTHRGILLATHVANVSRGSLWNLAAMYAFAAGQQYYVELTASQTSGQTHSRGQFVQISGTVEGPCGPTQLPGQ